MDWSNCWLFRCFSKWVLNEVLIYSWIESSPSSPSPTPPSPTWTEMVLFWLRIMSWKSCSFGLLGYCVEMLMYISVLEYLSAGFWWMGIYGNAYFCASSMYWWNIHSIMLPLSCFNQMTLFLFFFFMFAFD